MLVLAMIAHYWMSGQDLSWWFPRTRLWRAFLSNGASGALVASGRLRPQPVIAAMGPEPLAVVGALILRDIDSEWLESF